ncbi:MAG: UDP-glucose/GDP-mannose dehydrogenase family protein, partial [Pseudomonadota bacterium]|nr:UDP-glucose/GDP-mannose dehydrogenase family protein [Pseudomonadota bacterium]
AGHLAFSDDLTAVVPDADAVFIAVGTPSRRGDGHADLSYVYQAARDIAPHLSGYTVVVDKSTVPTGTSREVRRIISKINPEADFDVASNPEFLREGSAIEDFMRPNRVIIGIQTDRARDTMRTLYRPLFLIETPIFFTDLESAELAKYAANAFLATKIAFINEIADLCEKVGANVHDVAKAIGMDKRIGGKFLHPGPGYGGSCFPKDTLALARTGTEAGTPVRIVETVIDINDKRKEAMADRIIQIMGGDIKGKCISILGTTFKPNTDDMRDAPALTILPRLIEAGAIVRAFDPKGMIEAEKLIAGIKWCKDAYKAAEDADALVILTEWNEFRMLGEDRLAAIMAQPLMIDLRNIYKPSDMKRAGFVYHSIGRPDPDSGR